ncbi:hypothetical protein [Halobaculum sp. MBLA0143]|uniref:hypothetical protein n=1 Tax=Halobaculum sp. MBLA0143 TaxID=3079933 RepID=UPI0035250AC8
MDALDDDDGVSLSVTAAFAVCFATAVVWGLHLLDVVAFGVVNVAAAAAVVAAAVVLAGRE